MLTGQQTTPVRVPDVPETPSGTPRHFIARRRLRERQRLIDVRRTRVNRHWDLNESLELPDESQRLLLRREIRGAASRRAAAAYKASRLTRPITILLGAFVAFTLVARGEFTPTGPASSLIGSYVAGAGAACSLLLVAPITVIATAYSVAPSLRDQFDRWTLYALAGAAPLVFLLFAVINLAPPPAGSTFNPAAASSSAMALSGIALIAVGSLVGHEWLMRHCNARQCRPYDHVALYLVDAAASLHRDRHRWSSDNHVVKWRGMLDVVATQAERDARLTRRIGTTYEGTHSELRDEARRIAAVIRGHKRDLAEAYSASDVEAVATSLICGAQAFCAGDRTALLANAPDQVPQVNRFAAATARITPAVLLIAAGILLPMVPAIGHSGLASSLRWYLISLGVIMFITTRQDVTTKIGEAVAKALFKQ
ncbi:hypothetical protein [Streptomyces sp. NBC_00212]|uniref:hypothetical protein n=1 Tax=Streptomyces sp. NBC_00212 TaxID=2975684 RepID=UPI003249A584